MNNPNEYTCVEIDDELWEVAKCFDRARIEVVETVEVSASIEIEIQTAAYESLIESAGDVMSTISHLKRRYSKAII